MRNLLIAVLIVIVCFMWIASTHQSSATQPVAATAAESPDRAKKCAAALKDSDGGPRVWHKYWRDGEYGTMEVTSSYDLLSYDEKQALDGILRCALTNGRADGSGMTFVDYLDYRTHKEVAYWSPETGFGMK